MVFINLCIPGLPWGLHSWTSNPITHCAPPSAQVIVRVTSGLKLLLERLEFPKVWKFLFETNPYYLVSTCSCERSCHRDGFYALITEECENLWSIAFILEAEKVHIVYSVYK